MTSQYTSVNGTRMHFSVTGKGEPLLLLHGWTQTSAFWDPYLNKLARKFRVYALDLPGHGRTGTLKPDFSIRKASEDVEMFITQMELSNVKAIGLSYGGLLLLELAIRNPALVSAMVVIAVSDKFNGRERWKEQPAIEFSNLDKGFQNYLIKQHPFGEQQIRALFDKDLDYAVSFPPARLRRIESRVLVVNGDRDEVVGIDGAAKIFRNVRRSSLWIMPNAGHMAIDEDNKSEFLRTVEQFLLEADGSSPAPD
jgi:pimeloyl-ACP methyl ester carboxylesterase